MSICYVILVLFFVASFVVLNRFFTLIALDKKRECSPNADGVRFFGRGKTNHIIAKHVYTRRFVRDRSFLEVLILDRARPVWSACEITCFCYTAPACAIDKTDNR